MVFRRTAGPLAALSLLGILASIWLAPTASAAVPALKESLYKCTAITAANRLKPPAPLWEVNGEPKPPVTVVQEDTPAEAPCPANEIAKPKPLYGPHGGPPTEVDGEVRSSAAVANEAHVTGPSASSAAAPSVAPTDPYDPEAEGYRYVSMDWHKNSVGGSVKIAVADPHIEENGEAHTLAQLAYSYEEEPRWTIELGWDVDPGLFGDRKPHLFVFANNDFYEKGGDDCYDCDCSKCNFVKAAGAKLTLGQVLEPAENPIEFGVKYEDDNWWLYVYDEWIGYIEGSFWGNEFTRASWHSYYGEVDARNPDYDATSMGNGLFGSQPGSIKMAQPEHFPTTTSAVTETLKEEYGEKPRVSEPSLYSYGLVGVNENEWHFGGPGGETVLYVDYHGYCMGAGGLGERAGVNYGLWQQGCNKSLAVNEDWTQADAGNGESFQLINRDSELCAQTDDYGGYEFSSSSLQECAAAMSPSAVQRYKLVPVLDGGIKFKMVNEETGLCVTPANQPYLGEPEFLEFGLGEEACNGEEYQLWERDSLS